GSTPFDILWPRASVKPVEPDQKSKLFKSINWAILRSDFLDPASFTIACKAGYNDDPHHGHFDCGQFTLTWYGVPFIRDLGRIRYDELYFNEERWAYPQASSEGHNLVFVNGEQQMPAKLKDQPWKDGIGGEILDFRTSAKRDYVLMDPTHAYPGKELKKWRRNIVLEKPTVAVVVDEVSAHPGSTIAVRFFPGVTPPASRAARQGRETSREGTQYRIGANYVILSAQRHSLALIPLVLDNSCAIREDKLADLPVTEDARLNWIPYLEMVTTAKSNTSIVVTLFVPVNDEKEIEAIVRTASVVQSNDNHIEVGVETPAGKYKWSFEKEKDGLVLKD
ncbi:MAG TPA: heparinase II/III family protein, partial [Bacteroidota bacterium]|nr:heparinase II/III family protein [Bacteroidota bacterium]